MIGATRGVSTFAAFAAVALLGLRVAAAEPPPDRARAAAAYDAAVQAYQHGEHAAAARRFLEADALAPSEDALFNALVAAREARDSALVAEVAHRILDRPELGASLRESAQAALAGAEPAASPDAPPAASSPAPSAVTPPPPPPVAATARSPSRVADIPRAEKQAAWAKPVFVVGAGVTGALVGLVTWSGLDTLAARRRLPGTQSENDSVTHRAHRTDALLAGAAVAFAGTAYVGLRWVDWGADRQVQVVARAGPYGTALALRGMF